MPAAEATPYQDLRAYRNTERSAMPMCMAMLQNQAKNTTCQKVNFTCPASGAPPVHTTACRRGHRPSVESMPSCRRPTRPNATNTSVIHGAAMFATRATKRYPYAATRVIITPMTAHDAIHPRPLGNTSFNPGMRTSNSTPAAVAFTVIIAPARKQNITPLARL